MFPNYVPQFEVSVSGTTLSADVRARLTDLSYDNHLDKANMFSIRLADPTLELADSPLFEVGQTVRVKMGYENRLDVQMVGEIASVEPSFPASGAPELTIRGYDRSFPLRHNSPGRSFTLTNDALIVSQIAAEHLLVPVVVPSLRTPQDSVIQEDSDWDLLRRIAQRNYYEVYVEGDNLYFHPPKVQTERTVLEWGRNLMSFNPRLSSAGQTGLQIVRGYDEALAQTIVATIPLIAAGQEWEEILERLGSNVVDRLATLGKQVWRQGEADNFVDAGLLAKSLLQQLLEGLYEAGGACAGNPALKAGDQIRVQGVGKRFSGVYRLRQVTHHIGAGGYQTTFEISQRYHSDFLGKLRKATRREPPGKKGPPSLGLVPAVVKNNVDPGGRGRVQVHFPHISDANLSSWARLSTTAAGKDAGTWFLPDRDDEVLVGFLHGDIDAPVILGGMWNGRQGPPVSNNTPLNTKKVIKTKGGHQIVLDDASEGEVRIETSYESSFTMKHGGDLTFKTGKANGTLQQDGSVTIGNEKGECSIGSDGAITIGNGSGGITIGSDGAVSINGVSLNVDVSGDAGVVATNINLQPSAAVNVQ